MSQHRIERAYGSFVRTFTVPDDADASKVSAEFKDGVLKVHRAKDVLTNSDVVSALGAESVEPQARHYTNLGHCRIVSPFDATIFKPSPFAHARDRLRIERIRPAGKLRALPAPRRLSTV